MDNTNRISYFPNKEKRGLLSRLSRIEGRMVKAWVEIIKKIFSNISLTQIDFIEE